MIKFENTFVKGEPIDMKNREMINVYVDITAPIYWWNDFDTYLVARETPVAISLNTIKKIYQKEFTIDDFSCEHLFKDGSASRNLLNNTILVLNLYRNIYLNGQLDPDGGEIIKPRNNDVWWQMIQLLPSSYNQKRTVMRSYEILARIYHLKNRSNDEWGNLCHWIESLPCSEIITCGYFAKE